MLTPADADAIADQLLAANAAAALLDPMSASRPTFDLPDGYDVQARITARRRDRGWVPAGRKIGFTNRTIWPRYGVDAPMWAPVWHETVDYAEGSAAAVALGSLVQPRIEPEVVFKLASALTATDDPLAVLSKVEWIAAGFEIVQCPFPDWRFTLPDGAAAFGLHGRLVIGEPLPLPALDHAALAVTLAEFTATLSRDGAVVDHGRGANVLGSPALALAHLARLLDDQPAAAPLTAGEVITTGTITDAWPVAAGEVWTSDYGSLGLRGLTLTFT